jgi:hypothetical protein
MRDRVKVKGPFFIARILRLPAAQCKPAPHSLAVARPLITAKTAVEPRPRRVAEIGPVA